MKSRFIPLFFIALLFSFLANTRLLMASSKASKTEGEEQVLLSSQHEKKFLKDYYNCLKKEIIPKYHGKNIASIADDYVSSDIPVGLGYCIDGSCFRKINSEESVSENEIYNRYDSSSDFLHKTPCCFSSKIFGWAAAAVGLAGVEWGIWTPILTCCFACCCTSKVYVAGLAGVASTSAGCGCLAASCLVGTCMSKKIDVCKSRTHQRRKKNLKKSVENYLIKELANEFSEDLGTLKNEIGTEILSYLD